jgi:hypothetical protein
MTAILERRESESLWGRFCNWAAAAVVSPPFLYLSLSLLLESSVSSSSSSSEKWPMVRIFSHLSVTMELEW